MKNWETISKNFDVLYWWVKVGRDLFPLIFPVAMSILSVPDSNGKQERTFSAATWMDCKLNKRQSMLTFQSKVLLHQNKGFLVRYKDDIQEAYKAQAERRTKAVLDLAASMKSSDYDDEETELLIDAFEGEDDTEMNDAET